MALAAVRVRLFLYVVAPPQQIGFGACHHHGRVWRGRDVGVVFGRQPFAQERVDAQEHPLRACMGSRQYLEIGVGERLKGSGLRRGRLGARRFRRRDSQRAIGVFGGGCRHIELGRGRRVVLRDAGCDRRAGLDASQEGTRVYDDLALLLGPPLRLAVLGDAQLAEVEMGGVVGGRVLRVFRLLDVSLMEEGGYALAEGLCLGPAAVREGRIIRRGRGKMP